jgi:putative endonuclease
VRPTTKATGDRAEELVAAKLVREGFAIIGRNVRVGRLELDVIARRGSLVVFCEVRARTHDRIAAPWQSIDRAKIERLQRAARAFLATAKLGHLEVRFDVASVVLGPPPRVDYFDQAF